MGSFLDKGLIFCGCSFTFGQGLWHYSKLKHQYIPTHFEFDREKVSGGHIKYAQLNRFSRLVANHFNTFDVVKSDNGGSDDVSLKFLEVCFRRDNPYNKDFLFLLENQFFNFNYDDIEYIIYQVTQPQRSWFEFEINQNNYTWEQICEVREFISPNNEFKFATPGFMKQEKIILRTDFYTTEKDKKYLISIMFFDWLEKQNLSVEKWLDEIHSVTIKNRIKEKMEFYESKGIKTRFIIWPGNILKHYTNDEFFSDRLIKIEVKKEDKSLFDLYPCLDMVINYNKGMTIDDDDLIDNSIKDHHPSKKFHEIIANSIIKNIEKNLI